MISLLRSVISVLSDISGIGLVFGYEICIAKKTSNKQKTYSKKISRMFVSTEKQEEIWIKVRILVAIWHLFKEIFRNGNGYSSNGK